MSGGLLIFQTPFSRAGDAGNAYQETGFGSPQCRMESGIPQDTISLRGHVGFHAHPQGKRSLGILKRAWITKKEVNGEKRGFTGTPNLK